MKLHRAGRAVVVTGGMLTFISSNGDGNATWLDHDTGRIGIETDDGDVLWYARSGHQLLAVGPPVEPTEAMYHLLQTVAADMVGVLKGSKDEQDA